MEFEPVIGLEVHCQLKTFSKMFTKAPYHYGEPPNTLTDPVVMGLPGALPVMNWGAIRQAIRVGRIFGCTIASECKWDRKNYFYPDLPKGYQLSQFDQPLCLGGFVEIEMPGAARNIMGEHRNVKLTRIHLEEDVGKLTHFGSESLIDFNRAGTPLIEIVSDPDLFSADEAFAYLTSLRTHLIYAGISDCDMEKGQMRCDANVSVRPKGSTKLGVKVEIKNLNTISGVRNGIEYEIRRQIEAISRGEEILQETRRWNAEKCYTTSMRSKEDAHDYRYFPDPDLMPVRISVEQVKELDATLPEFPFDKQRRFFTQYNLPYTITSVICPDRPLSEFFEEAVKLSGNAVGVANFVANDLLRELANAGDGHGAKCVSESGLKPAHIADLVKLIDSQVISKQMGQDIFVEMFQAKKMPTQIVEEKGLKQTDSGDLERICLEVIAANPKPVEEVRAGKDKAINALKGQVMKLSQGRANPAQVDEMLKNLINREASVK
jgi:aspartyl-tRNA(Asn)/glutamyl-tRNA(Gln) amidotransferase subunit B